VLWITGDTVLHDGVRQVADRLQVDTVLLHLGGVHFGVSGPVRYTMTAQDAVELCRLLRPRTVILIHDEGWTWCERWNVGLWRPLPHRRRLLDPVYGEFA
jgi:L-ascorbate metabolism protein UlaG (beta-lactamase superfamily)